MLKWVRWFTFSTPTNRWSKTHIVRFLCTQREMDRCEPSLSLRRMYVLLSHLGRQWTKMLKGFWLIHCYTIQCSLKPSISRYFNNFSLIIEKNFHHRKLCQEMKFHTKNWKFDWETKKKMFLLKNSILRTKKNHSNEAKSSFDSKSIPKKHSLLIYVLSFTTWSNKKKIDGLGHEWIS